jgi:hypothetical protein
MVFALFVLVQSAHAQPEIDQFSVRDFLDLASTRIGAEIGWGNVKETHGLEALFRINTHYFPDAYSVGYLPYVDANLALAP